MRYQRVLNHLIFIFALLVLVVFILDVFYFEYTKVEDFFQKLTTILFAIVIVLFFAKAIVTIRNSKEGFEGENGKIINFRIELFFAILSTFVEMFSFFSRYRWNDPPSVAIGNYISMLLSVLALIIVVIAVSKKNQKMLLVTVIIYAFVFVKGTVTTSVIFYNLFIPILVLTYIVNYCMVYKQLQKIKIMCQQRKIFNIALSIITIVTISGCIIIFNVNTDMKNLPPFSGSEPINSAYSPNRKYKIIVYFDGGTYSCRGELVNEDTGKHRNIYWEYAVTNVDINWIDNNSVSLNNHLIDDVERDHYDWRLDAGYDEDYNRAHYFQP